MLKSNSENIQLTFEQLQQIDIAQKRLSNIQNETLIATKLLKEVKAEVERETKERIYQEELLVNLSSKIEKAKNDHSTLIVDIEASNITLSENIAKANSVGKGNDQKHIELSDREDKIALKESDHEVLVNNFKNESVNFEKEKRNLEKSKEAFKKAVETVIW